MTDGLHAGEWRQFGARPEPEAEPAPQRAAAHASHDPLHLKSRRAGLAKERDRAADIVAASKGVVAGAFEDLRFGRKLNVGDLEPVVLAISASVARNATALPSVTRMKERHEYTYLHSIAVCGLMVGLARELGLDAALTMDIGLAGLLHDVGKVRVPVALLDKPGPLDLDEYATVQQHTLRGHELLCDAGIESEIVLDVCLHHHERPDGKGYPSGISAQTLSVHARMGAVCDVYDAVTSTRSYKERWSPGAALEWMAGAQGQFDARVLRAFREMISIFPVGALVRLESQTLAVVLNERPDDPSYPDVCRFHCARTGQPLAAEIVGTRADPIVGIELASRWGLKDWEARRAEILRAFAGF